jgi:hypothetical protein
MAATPGNSSFTGGWLTVAEQNATIGYPDNPEWPGPVSENHQDAGPTDPGRSGPPAGMPPPAIPPVGSAPVVDLSGGDAGDTQATVFGYSAPMGPTFAQDKPFGPSGPVADTHGYDTGGTARKDGVDQPRSPGWFRRTLSGQTFNRQSFNTTTSGWQVNAANGRTDLDQYQGQDADAYDPRWIPYSERPLKANFASEAYPVEDIGGPYGIDGDLADMTPLGGQGNYAYTSPPDPYVTTAAPAGTGDSSYEPASGLEFVNYG